jgi:hypothetical protein
MFLSVVGTILLARYHAMTDDWSHEASAYPLHAAATFVAVRQKLNRKKRTQRSNATKPSK